MNSNQGIKTRSGKQLPTATKAIRRRTLMSQPQQPNPQAQQPGIVVPQIPADQQMPLHPPNQNQPRRPRNRRNPIFQQINESLADINRTLGQMNVDINQNLWQINENFSYELQKVNKNLIKLSRKIDRIPGVKKRDGSVSQASQEYLSSNS